LAAALGLQNLEEVWALRKLGVALGWLGEGSVVGLALELLALTSLDAVWEQSSGGSYLGLLSGRLVVEWEVGLVAESAAELEAESEVELAVAWVSCSDGSLA
jgi:hypothetical protein